MKAAFLDRDGVIIHDEKGYVFKKEDLNIIDGVGEALRILSKKNYKIIVITNQSGVARGYFSEEDVKKFHNHLSSTIQSEFGVSVDGFYYCPHHIDGKVKKYSINCECRKPGIALIEQAQKDFSLDLRNCFFVGDKDSDIQCAKNANIPGYLVNSRENCSTNGYHNLLEVVTKVCLDT